MEYGLSDWCNSQQTKRDTLGQSFFSRAPNLFFAFLRPSYFLAKPFWSVIMDLFVPVWTMFLSIFWWSLARMRLLISYPKRELLSLVPSVVVLYLFFPAVASTRYTQCSALGGAIFLIHSQVVMFLQFLRCN